MNGLKYKNIILIYMAKHKGTHTKKKILNVWRGKGGLRIIIIGNWLRDMSSNLDEAICISLWANHIYQPLRSGRIWNKVNF